MTRLQEAAIERLALEHGRVAVREGFMDRQVRATIPNGMLWHINEDGLPIRKGVNYSIDWRK